MRLLSSIIQKKLHQVFTQHRGVYTVFHSFCYLILFNTEYCYTCLSFFCFIVLSQIFLTLYVHRRVGIKGENIMNQPLVVSISKINWVQIKIKQMITPTSCNKQI